MPLGESGIVSGDRIAIGVDEPPSPRGRIGGSTGQGGTAPAAVGPVDGTGRPPLRLVALSGVDGGREWPLVAGRHRIGRAADAEIRLTDPQVARHDLTIEVVAAPDDSPTASPVVELDPGAERTNEVRLDGAPVAARRTLRPGERIQVGSSTLQVRYPRPARRSRTGFGSIPFERTPQFRRPVEHRQLDALGRIPVKPKPGRFRFIAVLVPLAMGVSMAYLFNSPRFLMFAAMSPVMAVGSWIESLRSGGRAYKRQVAELGNRIDARRRELATLLAAERGLRHEVAPEPVDLAEWAAGGDKRLWNRVRASADFLELRIGLGALPAATTVEAERQGDDDLRDEVAAAVAGHDRVVDVPVTVNLVDHPVAGLVGAAEETTSLATALIVQAAGLHSPEDLVLAAAVPTGSGFGRWAKWLPHVRSTNSPIAGPHLAGDAEGADGLIRAVARVAESRSLQGDQRLDPRWPWILVVIDRSLDPDPAVMARLGDLGPTVGVSVLWLTDTDRFVPRQAGVVTHLFAPSDGAASRVSFVDHDVADVDIEPVRLHPSTAADIARDLAPFVDASATHAAASVPSVVTLFEALGTEAVDPDWIAAQWLVDRGNSLPAPVGLTDGGPLVIDLVRDGPHGLIGGTSGAGKSELIQSLVANLIALSSPERVNLLFIDYKGGALSGLFSDVPHSVGAVTNLDALLSLRALTSLKAELDRRMALFEERRVKDLAEMLEKHPADAPASLVLVVDEFASLVRELPEFVEGIVSIAERGRSLGIHLLLSTQRPSGSINENIQQNTNLRMSLRMLDAGESRNVIGTPDAAAIPAHLKGRGFARLGPGELVPFQSAWSGAPLGGDAGPRPIEVAGFGDDSNRSATVRPGSRSVGGPVAAPTTELEALLGAVVEAAQRLHHRRGRRPWREPLPPLIPLADVLDDRRAPHLRCPEITIGMIDHPESQDQYPATIDLAEGSLAIYGAGGSGRTTALVTAACAAAIGDSRNGGGQLTIFGLDFGSRNLGVLNRLPQCEAVALGDDLEAVTRVLAVLERIFTDRQGVLAAAAAAADETPSFDPVLLVLDGFDTLADTFTAMGNLAAMQPWFDRASAIIGKGREVGIFTVLATGSVAGPSGRLMSSVGNRLTLRQTDDNVYRSFGIPSALASGLDLEPGQALTRTGQAMQIAVVGHRPGPDGAPEVDPTAVVELADGLVGSVAPECRTAPLPEWVEGPTEGPSTPGALPLGTADLTLAPTAVDVTASGLTILGPPRSGRSTTLLAIADQLARSGVELWALGPAGSPLAAYPGWARAGFGRASDVVPVLEELAASGEQFGTVPRFLIVDDADRFDDMSLTNPFKAAFETGISWIGSATGFRGLTGSNPLHREMKTTRNLLALAADDETAIQATLGGRLHVRPGVRFPAGRGVLVANGIATVIQAFVPSGHGANVEKTPTMEGIHQ